MRGIVCAYVGVVGSAVAWLLGGWDSSIATLLIFMLIDYVSGLVVAGVFKKSPKTESGALQSNACFKGLFKKVMIMAFVIIGHRLDLVIGGNYVRDGVCISFIVSELISIMENAKLMGVKLPKPISDAIDVLNKKGEQQ